MTIFFIVAFLWITKAGVNTEINVFEDRSACEVQMMKGADALDGMPEVLGWTLVRACDATSEPTKV